MDQLVNRRSIGMKKLIFCLASIFAFTASSPIYAEEKGFISTVFSDVKSNGVEGFLHRKKVREWYQENSGRMTIFNDTATLGCETREDARSPEYICHLKARLINSTNDELVALVVRIKIYNKTKKALVLEEVNTLRLSILPTVEKTFKLNLSSFSGVGKAKSQLGSDFSWNYDLIAYIPSHLYEGDNANALVEVIHQRNGKGLPGNNTYNWMAD